VRKKIEQPFLEGEKIDLRPLCLQDIEGCWRHWFNNPKVTRYMERGLFPMTRGALREFYSKVVNSGDNLVLAVVWKKNGRHIGNVGIHNIDWINRKAEFGIVIGESAYWGKGSGYEASRLMVQHAFNRLNMRKIFLGVRSDHHAAIRAYHKAGFCQEARLKEELYREGRYHDVLRMCQFNSKVG